MEVPERRILNLDNLHFDVKFKVLQWLTDEERRNIRLVSKSLRDAVDEGWPLCRTLTDENIDEFNRFSSDKRLRQVKLMDFSRPVLNSSRIDTIKELTIFAPVNPNAISSTLKQCETLKTLIFQNWTYPVYPLAPDADITLPSLRNLEVDLFAAWSEDSTANTLASDLRAVCNLKTPQLRTFKLTISTILNVTFSGGKSLVQLLARCRNLDSIVMEERRLLQAFSKQEYSHCGGGEEEELIATDVRNFKSLSPSVLELTIPEQHLPLWTEMLLEQRTLVHLNFTSLPSDSEKCLSSDSAESVLKHNSKLRTAVIALDVRRDPLTNRPLPLDAAIFSSTRRLSKLKIIFAGKTHHAPMVSEIINFHRLPPSITHLHMQNFNVSGGELENAVEALPLLQELSICQRENVVPANAFIASLNHPTLSVCRLSPFDENYDVTQLTEEAASVLEEAPSFTPLLFSVENHRIGINGHHCTAHLELDDNISAFI